MTTGELIELLSRFPADTNVEFTSHDGPGYGWLDVGGNTGLSAPWAPAAQIGNEGVL